MASPAWPTGVKSDQAGRLLVADQAPYPVEAVSTRSTATALIALTTEGGEGDGSTLSLFYSLAYFWKFHYVTTFMTRVLDLSFFIRYLPRNQS